MENPLVTTLTVTLVGMAVVFAAMGLILASMALLTRLARDRAPAPSAGNTPEPAVAGDDRPAAEQRARLRAAAIAVGLARARQGQEAIQVDSEPLLTPWGDYYRGRQLHPSGRGRIA